MLPSDFGSSIGDSGVDYGYLLGRKSVEHVFHGGAEQDETDSDFNPTRSAEEARNVQAC
jgi:hypothetical protein